MVRKPASSASDGSLKENAPKGKAKARGDAAKQGKMSRIARGSAARRVEDEPEDDEQNVDDEDQDADGEVDEDGEEQGASPHGRKRVRLNADGDSAPSDEGKVAKKERMKTLPRDTDGYVLSHREPLEGD